MTFVLSPELRRRGRRARRSMIHLFPFNDEDFDFAEQVQRRVEKRLPSQNFTLKSLTHEALPSEVAVICTIEHHTGRTITVSRTFNGLPDRHLVIPAAATISHALAQEAQTP